MGQPKTPGTMLQDGYSDTNVNKVLAAGTYPWTMLSIPHWFWQGLLSWDKPGGGAAGLRCYKWRVGFKAMNYGLPRKDSNEAISRKCVTGRLRR